MEPAATISFGGKLATTLAMVLILGGGQGVLRDLFFSKAAPSAEELQKLSEIRAQHLNHDLQLDKAMGEAYCIGKCEKISPGMQRHAALSSPVSHPAPGPGRGVPLEVVIR